MIPRPSSRRCVESGSAAPVAPRWVKSRTSISRKVSSALTTDRESSIALFVALLRTPLLSAGGKPPLISQSVRTPEKITLFPGAHLGSPQWSTYRLSGVPEWRPQIKTPKNPVSERSQV